MISTDIVNLLRRIEHARSPVETISQDVTSSTHKGIELDETLDMVRVYGHSVTSHENGLVNYAILSYYMPQIAGMRMLEELENKRLQTKLGDRSVDTFVDAEGYRVAQGGNTAFPGEDCATVQYGHISGRLALKLATYQLEIDKLNFVSVGEAIELKSEDGPVKPENIEEAIAGMR